MSGDLAVQSDQGSSERARLDYAYRRIIRRTHPDWDLSLPPARVAHFRQSAQRLHAAHRALTGPVPLPLVESVIIDPHDPRLDGESRPPSADECLFCASTPASRVTIWHQNGLPFVGELHELTGALCRGCGLATVDAWQHRTILAGWWGLTMFRNVRLITANAEARLLLETLDPPSSTDADVVALLQKPLTAKETSLDQALLRGMLGLLVLIVFIVLMALSF